MPVTVQGPDQRIYQFPDGTDKAAAIAYFKRKGIGAKSSGSPAAAAPPRPVEAPPRSAASRFLSSAAAPIKGAARSLLNANPTPEEQAKGLTSTYDFWMRPFERVVEAQTGQVDEARDLAKQGRYSEAAGHALASAVPLLGPWVADATQEYYRQLGSGDTAGALGTAVGNAALAFAPDAMGAAKELAPRAADAAARPIRAVTGTGPRAVSDLVKRTGEDNARAAEKAATETEKARAAVDRKNAAAREAAEKGTARDRAAVDKANEKLAQDRAAEVRTHFQKTKAAEVAEEKRSGTASRKAALESGVRTLGDKFQGDLKAVRDRAAAEADAKYQTLNAALGELPANGEFLPNALTDAAEKITGSETEPTIFRDIEKKIQRGDGFTYSDLQGYYSELGRELKRGTLPGDVYTAYNSLQDAIGDEMQRIAGTQGMGPQLADARATWRNLKQTFYDPKSPLRKAIDAKEPGGSVRALAGKDRTGIQALAQYDPQLAARANVIRGYDEEARGTRVPAPSTRPAPALAPRAAPAPYPEPRAAKLSPYAEPIAAPVKKIGEEEVRGAKAERLEKAAHTVAHRGTWAATWPLLEALRTGLRGSPPNLATMAAESGGTLAIVHGVSHIMESKPVVDFLTKATPRDIAQIPPELRGDFPRIVQQAEARGIKVSPALRVTFATAGSLAPRHGNPTDEWASPPR